MNEQAILDELLALLESNGIEVRSEPLGGAAGGLCTIKGKQIFFVDTEATTRTNAETCAEAVAGTVNIEKIFIKPQIRRFVEVYARK